jgi:hypothetical protein
VQGVYGKPIRVLRKRIHFRWPDATRRSRRVYSTDAGNYADQVSKNERIEIWIGFSGFE